MVSLVVRMEVGLYRNGKHFSFLPSWSIVVLCEEICQHPLRAKVQLGISCLKGLRGCVCVSGLVWLWCQYSLQVMCGLYGPRE